MRLLSFELNKILFSKKFLYILIGIVIGVAFLLIRNIVFESYIEKEAKERIDELLEIGFANAKVHESVLEANPDDEEEKDLRRINSSMINNLYESRNYVTSENWQERLGLEIDYYKAAAEYKVKGGEHSLTKQEIMHGIALNEKLLKANIPPEHETFSIALPNFMKQVVDLFITLGAIIIVILLVGEILSSEFENRSINLLFTQPLKRTHIISSKFWSSIILYVMTTLFIFAVITIIALVFGNPGTFNYPIVSEINNTINFLTIAEYILLAIIVVTVTIIMIISLCIFFSLLFKHTLSTLFATLGALLLGYALTSFVSWSPLAWFNPFQYLLPAEAILFQNGREWWQGIPVILVLTAILILLARQKVKTSKVD